EDISGGVRAGDRSGVVAAIGTWAITGLGSADFGKTVFEVNQAGYVQTLGNAGHVLAGTSQNQSGLDFANFKLFDISGTKFLDAKIGRASGSEVGQGAVMGVAVEEKRGGR